MYEDDKETRKKARKLKKSGGKPLGGKLFKLTAQHSKNEQTKIKQEMKMQQEEGDNVIADNGLGIEGRRESLKQGVGKIDSSNKVGDIDKNNGVKQPRVRRIVGAQIMNNDGSMIMPQLNSSNPDDFQAQLANFLKQQEQQKADGIDPSDLDQDQLQMPKITGRNIANNNRMRDPADENRGLKKPGSKMNVDEDYGSGGFANINSQVVNNG